eukprot:56166-Eustigmatos_ZCMA.PRE.1
MSINAERKREIIEVVDDVEEPAKKATRTDSPRAIYDQRDEITQETVYAHGSRTHRRRKAPPKERYIQATGQWCTFTLLALLG